MIKFMLVTLLLLKKNSWSVKGEVNETDVDRAALDNLSDFDISALLLGQDAKSETSAPTTERSVTQVPMPSDCECVPYYQCNANQTLIENGEGLIDISGFYTRLGNTGPCGDYLEVCCPLSATRDPDNPITPPPMVKPSQRCGRRNFNGVSTLRITGDENSEAQFGEFPWMVAILTRATEDLASNKYKCGGSIIHPQAVLTAAHCVKRVDNLLVRAGEWDTQRKTEPLPTQNVRVKDVIIHEQYYAGGLLNDVALLVLETPLELAEHIAPVCLPAQGVTIDSKDCAASGWGRNAFGKEGEYQVILKKVELPIVPREACLEALRKTRLGPHFRLHSSFICAGGVHGKDTCKGDGGGPLVCPKRDVPDMYEQAGIVAWGIGCGSDVPGVYASVAQFRNWIDKKLLAHSIHLEC